MTLFQTPVTVQLKRKVRPPLKLTNPRTNSLAIGTYMNVLDEMSEHSGEYRDRRQVNDRALDVLPPTVRNTLTYHIEDDVVVVRFAPITEHGMSVADTLRVCSSQAMLGTQSKSEEIQFAVFRMLHEVYTGEVLLNSLVKINNVITIEGPYETAEIYVLDLEDMD